MPEVEEKHAPTILKMTQRLIDLQRPAALGIEIFAERENAQYQHLGFRTLFADASDHRFHAVENLAGGVGFVGCY